MERRSMYIGFGVCLLALTTALAGSTAPSGSLTVGDFAVLLASKVSTEDVQGPLTPAIAADVLRKHGLKLNSDLNATVTEKDATDLFGQLGIKLQTERPENLLSPERAASLVGIFGSNLAAAGTRTGQIATMKTAGSTPVAPSLETTPYDCQQLPKPPSPCEGPQQVCNPCMYCCKVDLNLTGAICGQLCQKKNLVVSPTEPTP